MRASEAQSARAGTAGSADRRRGTCFRVVVVWERCAPKRVSPVAHGAAGLPKTILRVKRLIVEMLSLSFKLDNNAPCRAEFPQMTKLFQSVPSGLVGVTSFCGSGGIVLRTSPRINAITPSAPQNPATPGQPACVQAIPHSDPSTLDPA